MTGYQYTKYNVTMTHTATVSDMQLTPSVLGLVEKVWKMPSNWLWTGCLAITSCHFWALMAEVTARWLSATRCCAKFS